MLTNLKVYLRAIELDDYKKSIEWRRDQEIWEMLVGRRYFVSQAYEKKWVENAGSSPTDIKLAICDQENGTYIGNAYLSDVDFFNRSANAGYLLGDREYWGKGFGTDVSLLMLHHAFYDLGLQRVQARVLVDNKASLRVLEKTGYKKEGLLRKAAFKKGELQDLVLMAVLKEDFDMILKNTLANK